MKVLLVGQADSIFFEHYTKTIKSYRPDIDFDVFSVDNVTGKYDLSACNEVHINTWAKSTFKDIRGLRVVIKPFYTWFSLYYFLKKNKIRYDIIHFKWLIPGVILFPKRINKFTKTTVATFWGTEYYSQKLLFSNKIYVSFLKLFLKQVNAISYFSEIKYAEIRKLCGINDKFHFAIYGSSIYKEIEGLIKTETKRSSKKIIGINPKKITISIGYSGKKVHQHIKILDELFSSDNFNRNKENFHFILQMNYGCKMDYIDEVENKLKNYDVNYTLIYPKKLTDVDMARLRNATDIMIQLSKSDGRSSSIIENLLAGVIMISGTWLPYDIFKEKELYFHELDAIDPSLPKLLLEIAGNIEKELELCSQNKDKWGFETWEKVIPNWINIYEKVLQEA